MRTDCRTGTPWCSNLGRLAHRPDCRHRVLRRHKATNTFQVSATVGGAAINTSGAQSGTHTVATGSDSNTGLTTGRTGALLTIQAALDKCKILDLRDYDVTIQLATSKYDSGGWHMYLDGHGWDGTVTVLGDATTPTNVHVNAGSWIVCESRTAPPCTSAPVPDRGRLRALRPPRRRHLHRREHGLRRLLYAHHRRVSGLIYKITVSYAISGGAAHT